MHYRYAPVELPSAEHIVLPRDTLSLSCLPGVFVELVDDRGHYHGPDSDQVKEVMKLVDTELVRVLDAVEEAGDINLMVFSDHGMAARVGGLSDAASGFINVLDYVNATDWEYAIGSSSTPTLQIWPKDGNEDWVSFTTHKWRFS